MFATASALLFIGIVGGLLTGALLRLQVVGWIAGATIGAIYGFVVGVAAFVGDPLTAGLLLVSFAGGCAIAVQGAFRGTLRSARDMAQPVPGGRSPRRRAA